MCVWVCVGASLQQSSWYVTVLPWQQRKAITAKMSVSRLVDMIVLLSTSFFLVALFNCLYLSVSLSINQGSINLPICWSVYPSVSPSISLPLYLPVYWSILRLLLHQSSCLSHIFCFFSQYCGWKIPIYLSIYLSIFDKVCVCICLLP